MGRLVIAWWLIGAGAVAALGEQPAWNRYEFSQTAMAVPVRIVLYAPDKQTANGAAKAAFDRFNQLNGVLSDYDPESELRRLCDTAGEGKSVHVSDDLWNVLDYAQSVSARTSGAFDVTVGPIVRLWRRARRREELPPPEKLKEARDLVGYRLVRLDPKNHGVELLKPGMRLDLGGIAKGYAIDQALATLAERGIKMALVDAGGDVGLGNPPPDKPGWQIGVAALDPKSPPSRYVQLSSAAIATSGDTWQFVEIEGTRYSHLVNPHTGVGLTDHSTVTIVAPNAMTADALASAVSVLGPKKGLQLIDDTPGTAAFIVRAPSGRVETYESQAWKHLHLLHPSVH